MARLEEGGEGGRFVPTLFRKASWEICAKRACTCVCGGEGVSWYGVSVCVCF